MARYIVSILLVVIPVLCLFYLFYVLDLGMENHKEFIEEVKSPRLFISIVILGSFSIIFGLCSASTGFEVQKNIDTSYTYYTEAKVVAKDTTTVFKVNVNNKDYYYETDIPVKNNILDYFVNNPDNTEYILLMSDNTTRDDKSDDTILKIYYTNTNGGN